LWVVLVVSMLDKVYDDGKVDVMHQKLHEVPGALQLVFETIFITAACHRNLACHGNR
jgi:hypothetical protein